jgi:predicted DNA-binding protein
VSPRHKSDNSKNMRFEIRMTKETADKLEYCAEQLDATKTEVVQRGIDLVKKELDEKK